jgi:hypothetical protein
MTRMILGALVALSLGVAPGSRAAEPVDVALVLVADVSRSIDDHEFELQKSGYAAAFVNDKVVAAITAGPIGAIAVTYIEFAGDDQVRTVVDWSVIRDGESASLFGETLQRAPRSYAGYTSISAGIDFAVDRLVRADYPCERKVIDVSGDGTNNSGRDVAAARDDAVARGITVNGLTIINERPSPFGPSHIQPLGGLTEYYRHNVIGGPDSFVIEIHDFASFGEAMIRKLLSEIAEAGIGRRADRL